MKDVAQSPGIACEEGVFPTSQLARIALLGLRGRKERGWDSSAGASVSQATHGQGQSIVPCHPPGASDRRGDPSGFWGGPGCSRLACATLEGFLAKKQELRVSLVRDLPQQPASTSSWLLCPYNAEVGVWM